MHFWEKRTLHVHGANSFGPFQLTVPKGKVADSEEEEKRLELYECVKSGTLSELVLVGGKSVCMCV